MPDRILVIVSCTLVYFQYPDGTVSRPYYGHFCANDQVAVAEELRRKHRRAWKQAMAAGVTHRKPRPLPAPVPAPSWARDFGTKKRGWK